MPNYTWRNQLDIDLPMLMRDHDPVNSQTLDRGRDANDFDFGAGASEPTKLSYRRGYSFDGGDTLTSESTLAPSVSALSVFFTFSALMGAADQYLGEHMLGSINWSFYLTSTEIRFGSGSAAAANCARYVFNSGGQILCMVGVYDGTDTILYEGAVQRATALTPAAPSGADANIYLGVDGAGGNNLTGHIYHFGFWDGVAANALQAAQYHQEMMKKLRGP